MNTKAYIDALRAKTESGSIYAVARLLQIDEDTVRAWHLGRSHPDALACMEIAEKLDKDPMKVLADVRADAEKDKVKKARWRELARKLNGLAPVFLATAIGATTGYSTPEQGQTSTPKTTTNRVAAICIMSSLIARLLRRRQQSVRLHFLDLANRRRGVHLRPA